MIGAPFNRRFATRKDVDYIRAAIATPTLCLTASCVLHFDGPAHIRNYPVHRALHKLGLRSPAQYFAFISGSNPDDEMKRARLTRGSNAT